MQIPPWCANLDLPCTKLMNYPVNQTWTKHPLRKCRKCNFIWTNVLLFKSAILRNSKRCKKLERYNKRSRNSKRCKKLERYNECIQRGVRNLNATTKITGLWARIRPAARCRSQSFKAKQIIFAIVSYVRWNHHHCEANFTKFRLLPHL